jgi:hypothetical protein
MYVNIRIAFMKEKIECFTKFKLYLNEFQF